MSNNTYNEVSTSEIYIEGVILSIICLAAILGNMSMLIIIVRFKDLRTITNYFILCLSFADLLVAVVNMPVTVISIFVGQWILSDQSCVFFGYLNMLTLVTSVMSLCNISINRYVMVCKPLYFKKIYTTKRSIAMIAACVGVSAALSIPPLVGWATYQYIEVQNFCFCDWTKSTSYAIFMISCCFGLPFSVTAVCNVLIFKEVRASNVRVSAYNNVADKRVTKSSSSSHIDKTKMFVVTETQANLLTISEMRSNDECISVIVDGVTNGPINAQKIRNKKKDYRNAQHKAHIEEIRLATALAIVVVLFVICWLPYCISMLLSIYAPSSVPRAFHICTLLIGYSNSCINPVIYGVMNKRFAYGYRRLYCCAKENL